VETRKIRIASGKFNRVPTYVALPSAAANDGLLVPIMAKSYDRTGTATITEYFADTFVFSTSDV
jgi:hypothetical protein